MRSRASVGRGLARSSFRRPWDARARTLYLRSSGLSALPKIWSNETVEGGDELFFWLDFALLVDFPDFPEFELVWRCFPVNFVSSCDVEADGAFYGAGCVSEERLVEVVEQPVSYRVDLHVLLILRVQK